MKYYSVVKKKRIKFTGKWMELLENVENTTESK